MIKIDTGLYIKLKVIEPKGNVLYISEEREDFEKEKALRSVIVSNFTLRNIRFNEALFRQHVKGGDDYTGKLKIYIFIDESSKRRPRFLTAVLYKKEKKYMRYLQVNETYIDEEYIQAFNRILLKTAIEINAEYRRSL